MDRGIVGRWHLVAYAKHPRTHESITREIKQAEAEIEGIEEKERELSGAAGKKAHSPTALAFILRDLGREKKNVERRKMALESDREKIEREAALRVVTSAHISEQEPERGT